MDGSVYQAIGGKPLCRKLATEFYARAAQDPVLRPLFPGKSQKCAIDELAAFLAQFLDGPGEDQQKRWWLSLRESHLRFRIGPPQRDAWMRNMTETLDGLPLDGPMREAVRSFFEHSSAYVVNVGEAAPEHSCPFHQEFSRRWDRQLLLDRVVAEVKAGARPIDLLDQFRGNRPVFAGLLALSIRGGTLLDYTREAVIADPLLAVERYSGKTLLHDAAAAGNRAMVELLLELGADPNVRTATGHTPLYAVANECANGGADVVRTLVQAGATVDAADGVMRCTPLHMAARRGHVEIAAALLDCGAEIDRPDRRGDTPLRRALNCKQRALADFLVQRGARS